VNGLLHFPVSSDETKKIQQLVYPMDRPYRYFRCMVINKWQLIHRVWNPASCDQSLYNVITAHVVWRKKNIPSIHVDDGAVIAHSV
jgi:hypothetical protein